jgi:hypothetical protein
MTTLPKWIDQITYNALEIGEKALVLASKYDAVREDKGRPNRGTQIDIWQRLINGQVGQPWCAIFVAAMLLEAGVKRQKLPENAAAVYSFYKQAKAKGALKPEPARGRLGFWLNKSPRSGWWQGHIFFCASGYDAQNRFRTWEGNTDEAGSREGVQVEPRVRSKKSMESNAIYGFIDVKELLK